MKPPAWFYRDLALTQPPMRGVDVASLQLALGFPLRWVSGEFDLRTTAAVERFRAAENLPSGFVFDDTCARQLGTRTVRMVPKED